MTEKTKRKLYRSNEDKILAGVFGGLGEYFDIDPNLLRVIFLFFLVITFFSAIVPFLVIYLISALIIPTERIEKMKNKTEEREDDNKIHYHSPVYKKWWFWLIIIILTLPIILMIFGFLLFVARSGEITESMEVIERRVVESPDSVDQIIRYEEE